MPKNARRFLAAAVLATVAGAGLTSCAFTPIVSAIMENGTPAANNDRASVDRQQAPANEIAPDATSMPTETATPTVSAPVFGPPTEDTRETPRVTTRISLPGE